MQLFFSSMSIQNLPFRVSRRRLIAAMAASALDPHLLVGLDAKSTPCARSFRERAEVCLLCVSDADMGYHNGTMYMQTGKHLKGCTRETGHHLSLIHI